MDADQLDQNYDKPVAYDAEGRPLYAHPPVLAQAVANEKVVDRTELTDETRLKHETSVRYYPSISLKKGEYVICAVRRHPIGVVIPLSLGIILMAVVMTILFNYDLFVSLFRITGPVSELSVAILPLLLISIIIAVATYVAYFVYTSNRFFITNESVIQDVRAGLFSRKVKTARLDDIEDVTYNQRGMVQQLFNFGSLRVNTEAGRESYHFTYVANPREYAQTLNDAIENIKNLPSSGD